MLTIFAIFAIICILIPNLIFVVNNNAALVYSLFAVSIGIFAVIIITVVMLFQRYNDNLYSSEGYLMHTLPTSGKKLLASKLFTAFIWITAAFLLSFAALASACNIGAIILKTNLSGEMVRFIKGFGNYIFVPSRVPIYIVEYILYLAMFLLQIYFSISVARLDVWHKFGKFMGVVTFFAVEIITSIPGFIYDNDCLVKIGNITNKLKIFGKMTAYGSEIVSIVTAVIVCVALFFSTAYLLERKTSLK